MTSLHSAKWDQDVLTKRGPPPRIERIAKICIRVGIGLLSVGFIIAPMVVLSYIDSKEYVLAAALFAGRVFCNFLLIIYRASILHEVVGVIAIYSAVLVVFVGNTILTKSS